MANINEKKQLSLISDENDFLKENLSLRKEINKMMEKQASLGISINKTLSNSLKTLAASSDIEEQIEKSTVLQRNLHQEITDLKKVQTIARSELGTFSSKKFFDLKKKEAASASLKSVNAELNAVKQYQRINDVILKQLTEKQTQMALIASLGKKADLAHALGLGRFTQGVSTFFNKLALLQGKNLANATNILSFFNKYYSVLVAISVLVVNIWEKFKELDKAAWESRKAFGMMRIDHKHIRDLAEDIHRKYAQLGVTATHVYNSVLGIAKELGSGLMTTIQMTEHVSLMAAQFGISEEITVRMLKTLGQIGRTSAAAQVDMSLFAQSFSAAADVPFPQVMQDIANASVETKMMMSKVPLELIKAAVEARRMGTTLDKMTSSSRRLLNFTESIEAEMEASVLLGQPINLQLARQLSFRGKILEANKEILKWAKKINFEKLDVYSQEKFAAASGKTAEELFSMLQSNRENNILQKRANEEALKGNLTLKNKLDTIRQIEKSSLAEAKARAKSADHLLKTKANQTELMKITQAWDKVVMELGYIFLPAISATLSLTAATIPLIAHLVKVVGVFSSLAKIIPPIGAAFVWVGKRYNDLKKAFLSSTVVTNVVAFFKQATFGASKFSKFLKYLSRNVLKLFSFFSSVGKLAGPFLKAIPVIGWVITGVTLIYKLVQKLSEADFTGPWWKKILTGLQAVGKAIWETLTEPFVDAWNFIKGLWGPGSPSKVGLAILKGIQAVGGMLYNTITAPFKKAWGFIRNLFSEDSTQSLLKNSSVAIPLDKSGSDDDMKSYRELESNVPVTINRGSAAVDTSSALLQEIKALRADLSSGKVAVYLDSQLVSLTLNRNSQFSNGYGTNKGMVGI